MILNDEGDYTTFESCSMPTEPQCCVCRDVDVLVDGETCDQCQREAEALADAISDGSLCSVCHGSIVWLPDGDSAYRECSECGRQPRVRE